LSKLLLPFSNKKFCNFLITAQNDTPLGEKSPDLVTLAADIYVGALLTAELG
jgi:hypothetical protein